MGATSEAVLRIAGHTVSLTKTPKGLRAVGGSTPEDPDKVEVYLISMFKLNYFSVRAEMEKTAGSYSNAELSAQAMALYERFRPAWKGWGVKGELHLSDIRAAKKIVS